MAGIYIHIPFCKSRCRYCDFFSTTALEKQQQYVDALLREWGTRQHELQEPVHTIYIGGGTPSTLVCEDLRRIILQVATGNNIVRHNSMEITIEANPGDITTEKVQAWREMGINRLSIGVQSLNDTLLQLIGRRHNATQVRQAIKIAQAGGFDNISIDLMYALPSQTMEQWKKDVEEVLQWNIQHLSCYGLIYEEGTTLTQMLERGEIEMVDEEVEMAMYDYLVGELSRHGYLHYEVSNFAREGFESKHNSSYWNNTAYLGLGAGAHSYDGKHQRSWNVSDLDTYINQAISGQWQRETELLTDEDHLLEQVMLGLRTKQGVNKAVVNAEAAQRYIEQGLLIEQEGKIIATTTGMHVLNRVIEDLLF